MKAKELKQIYRDDMILIRIEKNGAGKSQHPVKKCATAKGGVIALAPPDYPNSANRSHTAKLGNFDDNLLKYLKNIVKKTKVTTDYGFFSLFYNFYDKKSEISELTGYIIEYDGRNTIRISATHSPKCDNLLDHNQLNVLSITLITEKKHNTFKPNEKVNAEDYVYFSENNDNGRYRMIINGIIDFLESGIYTDYANADKINTSPKNDLGELKMKAKEFNEIFKCLQDNKGVINYDIENKYLDVVKLDKHNFNGSAKEVVKQAEKWAKENICGEFDFDYGKFQISKKSIEKILSAKLNYKLSVHLSILPQLVNITKKSLLYQTHFDRLKIDNERKKGNKISENSIIHRFISAVKLNNEFYGVKLTLKQTKENNKILYTYDEIKIELLSMYPAHHPINSVKSQFVADTQQLYAANVIKIFENEQQNDLGALSGRFFKTKYYGKYKKGYFYPKWIGEEAKIKLARVHVGDREKIWVHTRKLEELYRLEFDKAFELGIAEIENLIDSAHDKIILSILNEKLYDKYRCKEAAYKDALNIKLKEKCELLKTKLLSFRERVGI